MKGHTRVMKGLVCAACLLIAAAALTGCGGKNKKDKENNETNESDALLAITEVMPSNTAALQDAYGEFSDWLEITNVSNKVVKLNKYYLSDDEADLQKFRLPKRELQPEEAIVVFAADRTESGEQEIDAPFKLSKDGEDLFLSDKNGTVLSKFSYAAATVKENCSIMDNGLITPYITPGFSNDDSGYIMYQNTEIPPEELLITEAMNANDSYAPHDGDVYSDWVEIYNNTSSPIDLSQYCISDSRQNLEKSRLPAKILQPQEYLTVHCDDSKPEYISYVTGFSLGSEEQIYLSKDGVITDYMSIQNMPYGYSYGRRSNGGYGYFPQPSPGLANSTSVAMRALTPVASSPEGVYDDVDSVTVSLVGEGTILYTTDGSEPTESSERYTAPIRLSQTTVIRAKSIAEGKLDSATLSASYIINEHHTLPVLSLTTNRENLFDPETGIYVKGNHENYYQDWEKPANLTLFENGKVIFNADCGLKMNGAGSREDCPKKSMRVHFRTKYGTSKVNADLFGNGVTKFKSLILRGGEDTPYTIFRNEAFTKLAEDTEVLTQSNKYCVLYVNGEYFGLFALSERFSDYYFAQHFGVDEATAHVEHAPVESDDYVAELIDYAEEHDLTKAENYAYLEERVNFDSMIDWFVLQAYSHNRDLDGNLRYLYSDTEKVRYAFFDLDWAFYAREDNFEFIDFGRQYSVMFVALLENPEFRARVIDRTGVLLRDYLTNDKMLRIIDQYHDLLEPEVARERQRWTEGESKQAWELSVEYMKEYLEEGDIREEMVESLVEELSLTNEEESRLRSYL